jgi:hypothetical protein
VVQSKKAGGTKTMWDVVKHPIEVLRDSDDSGPSGKVEFAVPGVGPALLREAVDGFRSGRNPMS